MDIIRNNNLSGEIIKPKNEQVKGIQCIEQHEKCDNLRKTEKKMN